MDLPRSGLREFRLLLNPTERAGRWIRGSSLPSLMSQAVLSAIPIEVSSSGAALEPILVVTIITTCAVGLWILGQIKAYRRRRWATELGYAVRAKDFDAMTRLSESRELERWAPALIDVLQEVRDTLQRDRDRVERAESARQAMVDRFEQSPVPELTVDPTGCITSANDEACWVLGRLRSDLIGVSMDDVLGRVTSSEREAHGFDWAHGVFAARDAASEVFAVTRRDGRDTYVLALSRSITPGKAEAVTLLDITGLKPSGDVEDSVGADAISRLAGIVASDFNDPLTTILGHASILGERYSKDESTVRSVAEVTLAAERGRLLTQQLMAFSRSGAVRSELIDLNEAVRNSQPQLEFILGETTVVLRLAPDAGAILSSAVQVAEILIHLVQNASEAMGGAGTVVIETQRGVRVATDGAEENVVRLVVLDEGHGIRSINPTRLVDPFHSTKSGRDIGLGLAIVNNLVEGNGGELRLASRKPEGTRAEITWMAQSPLSASENLFTPAEEVSSRESENTPTRVVCVVEDDTAVRGLVVGVLENARYQVLQAANGDEAEDLFRSEGENIDLLVTDVNMPGMTGSELYERLRKSHDELNVLYMSGFVDREVFRVKQPWTHAFIQKPFSPSEIVARVGEILKRRRRGRRRRVLVVDDEEATRRVLQRLLDGLEVESFLVGDGDEALETLEHLSVDAVISVLPKVDGLTTCAEIHRRHPGLKIIAMAGALPSARSMDAARTLGACSTLSKPFSRDDLQLALETAFQED